MIDPPVILQLLQSCAYASPECDKTLAINLLRTTMALLCSSLSITEGDEGLVYHASHDVPFPDGCYVELQVIII